MKSVLTGELFVREGLIGREDLEAALRGQVKTGERLGALLVRMGLVTEEDRLKILGARFALACALAGDYPSTPPPVDLKIKSSFMKHYKVVPLSVADGTVRVAAADPADPYPFEAIASATGLEVEPVLGLESDILRSIDACYGNPVTVGAIIEGMGNETGPAGPADEVEQLTEAASEAPVINLVNLLITRGVGERASDIHIEPFEDSVHVRFRVDGVLRVVETLPGNIHAALSSRVKIMSRLNIAERRLPQDGRIKFRAGGKEVDIRVSTSPTRWGESVVMRLLDPAGVISLEAVGFSESNREAFESLITQPHGMILVTGPTGSGKSTTLYAGLARIDTTAKKVITIEDPVEYNLPGVNQINVKPSIGLTFANGLRSIVRQDPDVIMIGEIRDRETADIAVHSALTGHLVLSTLHTNDAPGAVTRLLEMGVEGYLISSSLLGILAQRLVRVLCPGCKVPCEPKKGAVPPQRGLPDGGVHYRPAGCERCGGTGYAGRTGIFELMVITEEIRRLVVEKRGADEIRRKAVEQGMITLREDGWKKVAAGVTSIEEVARVTLGDRKDGR